MGGRDAAPPATHPERIGKYRIDQVLGEGAMGVVYKAHDTVLERDVAVKVVRTALLTEEDRAGYLARFKREAQAAARFHHPNIIGIYDFAEHEGAPFIAMEYVVGRPLRDMFREQGRLPVREAGAIVVQMLSALACVHGFGIVHRDIKPANVIIVPGGVVKLADFGVARINASELTLHGSVIGTPGYMSPEQYKGDAIDGRSDLFSTGILLYELIAGEKPFRGASLPELLYKTVYEPPRDLGEHVPTVSDAIRQVVVRALAKAPDERFQSADAFAAALKQAMEQPDAVSEHHSGVTVLAPMKSEIREAVKAASSGPPTSGSSGTSGTGSTFSPERLETAERALAYHLGPIAKLLVKKAAAQSASLEDLYSRLATHLPRESERTAFLTAVGRR